MDARRQIGAGLLVVGLGLVAVGAVGLVTGAGAAASPTTADAGPTATPADSAATATPTMSLPPTVAPTPTTTVTATPAPTPSPTTDPEAAVRAFFNDLVTAVRAGNEESMGPRLNGAVIDRYGAAACEAKLASDVADPTFAVDIIAVHPLAPWDYVMDGRTTPIGQAWTVDANVTTLGATASREIHVAPMDGAVSWFTDCGDPLPAP
jgi:hypothetical protein